MNLSKTQKEEAINYLVGQVSLDAVWQVHTHRHDSAWLKNQHFGLGLWVRNTLRVGGFEWDDLTHDAEWLALILMVVERVAKDEVRL